MPEPIPIELVASGRELSEPRLSPDGDTVAYVERSGGGAAIIVVPIGGAPARVLTSAPPPAPGRGLGGGCFDWLPDGRGVVYASADGELWLQPLDAGPRPLTSLGRTCRAPAVAPDGSFVAVVVDEAEICAVDLGSGDVGRLDDGQDGFCFDPCVGPDSATVIWQGWSAPSMPWDDAVLVAACPGGDGSISRRAVVGGAVQQPRFLPDGSPIVVHDGSGWLNVAVVRDESGDRAGGARRGDAASGAGPVAAGTLDADPVLPEPVEHAGPTWGTGQRSYAVSPDGQQVAVARNEAGFGSLSVIGLADGAVREIARGVHGALSWRGGSIVALRSGPRTPTQVVRYAVDRLTADGAPHAAPDAPDAAPSDSDAADVLAVGPVVAWDAVDLPDPDPVAVPHEGATLHARRYPAGQGRMLAWVHGGPTDQWPADFRPRVAYWWSRGWDVLVVDPRGSTGHGRDYQRALNGRWGRLDVDDTAALVAHAHRQGWAGAATTVAIGGSSGGLTVLGLLADHPGLVAAGVASYPVSDLVALTTVDHRFEAHYTETLVGPSSDRARYEELSPITRAERITSPLLVFHGTDDPVVPIAQSEALVERIRAAGGAAELVAYDGEGHGIRDPANQRDEYARTEAFVAAFRR